MNAPKPELWAASAARIRGSAELEAFGRFVLGGAFARAMAGELGPDAGTEAPSAMPAIRLQPAGPLFVPILCGDPAVAAAAARDIGARGIFCCGLSAPAALSAASAPPALDCATDAAALQAALPGRCLALVGPMASGKSTIGPLLARRLGLPFFDSDRLVEKEAGKSIPGIFASDGEETFRALESRVLASLLEKGNCVLATGGGAVLAAANRALLKEKALTVWLHASPADLLGRLGRTRRPLLEGGSAFEKISTIYNERIPLYAEASAFLVPTRKGGAESAAESIYEEILPACLR